MDEKLFWLSLVLLRHLPKDVHALIMKKTRRVRNLEIFENQPPPLCGRSTYAKHRRANRLCACVKCGRTEHLRRYNKCAEPISGRLSDRLRWIRDGQSKEYPETPSYSGPMLNRFVRNEINRANHIPEFDSSDAETI